MSNLEYGIRLHKGGASGSIVSNCTVEYNGYVGVHMSESSNIKVLDSRANHNGQLGSTAYTLSGIAVIRSTNCEILGNTVSSNNAAGAGDSDGNINLRYCDGVVVRGNTLGGGGPHYGFYVWESYAGDVATIEQNIVFGHSRYGIQQNVDGATILSTSNLYYGNKHGLRPEGIITSRWDTFWANNDSGAQADGAAILDIQNSLVIGNTDWGIGEGASATVISDYNDVFGNGSGPSDNYIGLVAGANDVSVDPVFYSIDPADDGFLYLTWNASPASVLTGSDVGNQMGARPISPASLPRGTIVTIH